MTNVQQNAEKIREAAGKFKAELVKYKTTLKKIPAKGEVKITRDIDDETYTVWYHRGAGQEWVIDMWVRPRVIHQANVTRAAPPEIPVWQSIEDAGLRKTLNALPLVEDIVTAIESSQQQMIEDLAAATERVAKMTTDLENRVRQNDVSA